MDRMYSTKRNNNNDASVPARVVASRTSEGARYILQRALLAVDQVRNE